MFIRWRKWRQSNTGMKIADPRQSCFFDAENKGVVDVKFKQVVDRLLAHPNEFEIAYDLYGIAFGEDGRQIEENTITGLKSEVSQAETVKSQSRVEVVIPVHTNGDGKVSDSKRQSMLDRMAKMRASRKRKD